MPDETHKHFPFLARKEEKAPSDMFGPHTLLHKYATWNPDCSDPNPVREFPLRELAPDMVGFLVEAGCYSQRDINYLAERVNLDVDPKNHVEFYNGFLDVIEGHPWIFPLLDVEVALNRTGLKMGAKPTKSTNSKLGRIVPKLLLGKMRLANIDGYEDRLGEFLVRDGVCAHLVFGAFCEYALDHYGQVQEAQGDDFSDMVEDVLMGAVGKVTFEEVLAEAIETNEWEVLAGSVIGFIEKVTVGGESASPFLLDTAVMVISAMAESLGEDTPPETFRLLSHLAACTADIAGQAPEDTMSRIVEDLRLLGIGVEDGDITQERADRLAEPRISALANRLLRLQEGHAQRKERSDEIEVMIAAATREKRFGDMRDLIDEAEALQTAQITAENLHTLLQGVVTAALGDDEEDYDHHLALIETSQTESGTPGAEDAGVIEQECRDGDDTPADSQDINVRSVGDMATTGTEEDDQETTDNSQECVAAEIPQTHEFAIEGNDQESESGDNDDLVRESGTAGTIETEDTHDQFALDTASGEETGVDAGKATSAGSDDTTKAEIDAISIKELEAAGEPPLSTSLLSDLFSRGLVGIAADASEALEACRYSWPIEAAVLRTAAASRARHGDYSPETQRFLALAERAASTVRSDLGRNVLFGALLRPAILQQSFSLRAILPDLARGSLGAHLREVAEAIAGLDFDFPPGSDALARISGAQILPQRRRISEKLAEWSDSFAQKTSRWIFATGFMHHTVSDAGLIGKARAAIETNRSDAVILARTAIEQLATTGEIEDRAIEYGAALNKPLLHLHPKGIEYLHRHFSEALGLLSAWITAYEQEKTSDQRSEKRLRTTVGNLASRLGKARNGLFAATHEGVLETAVSDWLISRIDEVSEALKGSDTGDFATIEEALTAERDLLPSASLRGVSGESIDLDALVGVFDGPGIPDARTACAEAISQGAFDTATRLAERYSLVEDVTLAADMTAFAETWNAEISTRQRAMKALAKVDYSHQEEIVRWLSWCDSALERIGSVGENIGVEDLDDIPLYAGELDRVAEEINANIRADQEDRIRKYRTEQNAEDADGLLVAARSLTLEAVEDRIAQLRDGRSAATFEAELDGLMADFAPGFIEAANGPDWPRTTAAFETALETQGLLFTDEARRGAAADIFSLYRDICNAIPKGMPSATRLKAFFEDLGFEDARIGAVSAVGRTGSWKMPMSGEIRHTDWFLPPAFGSKATRGYALFLVERDTLPEAIEKLTDPEVPTILLLAGVADQARRHDIAQRLRARAIPAILIDEALVGFAAIRRETRLRTIFECGLPYGRVEPYTTDAGHVAPEMFFGRGEEIRDIMSRTADGCLVYGGRQLGKSALISHVSRTRHAPDDNRIVVRREVKPLGNSESAEEIWSHLNAMLVPEGVVKPGSRGADAVSQDIRAWLATRQGGQIICMFDETDHFMAADTKDDYPQLSRLKELMEDTDRAFKVVFAGLHNVKRMHRQPNSPLAHLGRPICIGPLNRTEDDKRAAHDLVIQPMRAAGFRFESMEAVEEILAWANYYPSLIQEYARGLLSTLHGTGSGKTYRLREDGPLWTIPTSELFNHRGFQQIEIRIREKFHLTLDLDPRYALVAYTLAMLNIDGHEHQALVSGFRAEELLEHASSFWPRTAERPSGSAFDALLDEMFDLGVLGRVPIPETKRFTYCLRTRQVAAMLGSREDIEHALLELTEKDPTVAYDRTIHRRRYAAPGNAISAMSRDAAYSPLTDFQIEQILDPERSPVQIVCGLEILGITRIGTALRRIADAGSLPGVEKGGVDLMMTETSKDIRQVFDKLRKNDTRRKILVHMPKGPQEAREQIDWLERQRKVLDGRIRPILVLDAQHPAMRAIANRRREQSVFLGPWGAEMIRVHLSNIERTDLDTSQIRDRILTVTGGIPADIVRLVSALCRAPDLEDVFTTWGPSLRNSDPIVSGEIGKILQLIDITGDSDKHMDPGDYDALDDIIRESTGADLITHGPDMVATGMLTSWTPKTKRIRSSALGDLIARMLEG